MATFKCEDCGKEHDLSELAIVHKKPDHYFKIPANERAARIKINDDLCIIDNRLFLIRGVLEVPVKGVEGGAIQWGVWALVKRPDFDRYRELWDADIDPNEPPFRGRLSGGPHGYPEADMATVTIHMQSNGQRPIFKAVSAETRLGKEQREGISTVRLHKLLEIFNKK